MIPDYERVLHSVQAAITTAMVRAAQVLEGIAGAIRTAAGDQALELEGTPESIPDSTPESTLESTPESTIFGTHAGPPPAAAALAVPVGGITVAELHQIMPNLSAEKAAEYVPLLNAALAEGQINTSLRRAAFLAQLAHESGELRYFEEFADGSAYEGRADLGNTHPGDGRRFKGRGPIQLTGRSNYARAGEALGLDLVGNPELAARPDVGFRVAQWYWTTHNLNALADGGPRNFDAITRAINGGLNGKADRDRYYARALQVFGAR